MDSGYQLGARECHADTLATGAVKNAHRQAQLRGRADPWRQGPPHHPGHRPRRCVLDVTGLTPYNGTDFQCMSSQLNLARPRNND